MSAAIAGAAIACIPLVFAGSASAAVPAVFTQETVPIPCTQQSDGVRFCQGSAPNLPSSTTDNRVTSFDGSTPLDVNVTLPAAPPSGPDGSYPLVMVLHGWGGSKKDLDTPEEPYIPSAHEWARLGYAVVNASDRGFAGSCGSSSSRTPTTPNGGSCNQAWIKLMDTRYEVHDAQWLAGLLVDQGLVDPQRIGAVGESYGGGESLMLATLKDRVMDATSGKLVPWKSPKGTPLRIAAAAPSIPWSDLINSLVPNGRTLDYTLTGPQDDYTPVGVMKQSFVSGLYAEGQAGGYIAPSGVDPQADLSRWYGDTSAGEPYESNPDFATIISQFVNYRGAYYLLDGTAQPNSEPPAPLLLSNGFTDDLFPVDETVRYYNLERSLYPSDPVSLMYMDYGHERGTNKAADLAQLKAKTEAWFAHYVQGSGPDPGQTVTALTQTCPASAPSGGPYTASTWQGLHPGELDYSSAAAKTVLSSGGNPSIDAAVDPIAGGGNACATTSAADQANTATYRLPTVTGSGYTVLGAATIIAHLSVTGQYPELAMRLWDVDPSGNQTLVARGLYRPFASDNAERVLQLHPGAWHFAAGHVPKLELLGRDSPYGRASNGTFQIAVSDLQLRLPTHETSGNGIIPAQPLPLPPGARAAPGVRTVPLVRSGAVCVATRSHRFAVPHRRGQRVVRVRVYVNGKLRLNRRGHNVTRVTLKRLPHGKFKLRIVSTLASGRKVTSVHSYRGCGKAAHRAKHKRKRHRRRSARRSDFAIF